MGEFIITADNPADVGRAFERAAKAPNPDGTRRSKAEVKYLEHLGPLVTEICGAAMKTIGGRPKETRVPAIDQIRVRGGFPQDEHIRLDISIGGGLVDPPIG